MDVKRGSRSLTITLSIPCNLYISLRNTFANYGAFIFLVIGIACIIFVKRSTTTNIASQPFLVFGKLIIKSILIYSQGYYDIGKGYNIPLGF